MPINANEVTVEQLQSIKDTGVAGVVFDIFWGKVETEPNTYDFKMYVELLQKLKALDLKAKVILSTHTEMRKGIDLPKFVHEAAETNPKIWTQNSKGEVNKSHISLWYLNESAFPGEKGKRSAAKAYMQFYDAFRKLVLKPFEAQIQGVIIGFGQNGQLKFTNEKDNKSDFCTDGDFQIYDDYAQKYLKGKIEKTIKNYQERLSEESWEHHDELQQLIDKDYSMMVAQNHYLRFVSKYIMGVAKVVFQKYPNLELSIKLPSIHWGILGERNPEKRSGLIINDSNDYADFFKLAKEMKFSIIFDGLGLFENKECLSDPDQLVEVFTNMANEYGVVVWGENVNRLKQTGVPAKIMSDMKGFDGAMILRAHI